MTDDQSRAGGPGAGVVGPLARLIAEASVLAGAKHPCTVLGHKWRHTGGMNCGCEGRDEFGDTWRGQCSVPVYECEACGDCDYGDNAEARDKRGACAEEFANV